MGQNKTQEKGCEGIRHREYPEEQTFEDPAVLGGYEHPVQVLPSGEGRFRFESNDPNLSDGFETVGAEHMIRRLYCRFGPVNLVRTGEAEWSVELGNTQYGAVMSQDSSLHQPEGVTSPLIPNRTRGAVQESATGGKGGYQTRQFAMKGGLRPCP